MPRRVDPNTQSQTTQRLLARRRNPITRFIDWFRTEEGQQTPYGAGGGGGMTPVNTGMGPFKRTPLFTRRGEQYSMPENVAKDMKKRKLLRQIMEEKR